MRKGLMCGLFSMAIGLCLVSNVKAESAYLIEASLRHEHSASGGSCYTPVYHVHSGSSSSYGACYTDSTTYEHEHGSSCYSETGPCSWWEEYCDECGGYCCVRCGCGSPAGSHTDYYGCPDDETVYHLTCNKSTSTIDSYKLNCTKGNSVVGTFGIRRTNKESYELCVERISGNDDLQIVGYEWNTGCTSDICAVNSNDTYSCVVCLKDSDIERTVALSYEVTDYDTEKPTISMAMQKEGRCQKAVVTFTGEDNVGVVEYLVEKME